MHYLIQQVRRYLQSSVLLSKNQFRQPLINNDEIINLRLKTKNRNKTNSNKHDSAFKQIGDTRSIFRGSGMDFEESRRYQPGDDPRYMNWALTARTGQHYMKVFRQERQPGVFIVVDRRQTMLFGTQVRLKATQAVRAAAIAAFTAQEKNYSIGGVILDDNIEWFKENQNKQAAYDFIHRCARPALPLFDKKQKSAIKINNLLINLNEIITKGSSIFIISDFYDLDKSCQATLLQLSTSHRVNAIQIIDPAELTLPEGGETLLKSNTAVNVIKVNTNSEHEQIIYQNVSKQYFDNIQNIFDKIAIPCQQILTTDESLERKVVF